MNVLLIDLFGLLPTLPTMPVIHDHVIKWKPFPCYWPLCEEFTSHNFPQRPVTELWCFLWSAPQSSSWANNGDAGDLRRHRTHYDVTVMFCALVCTRSVAWVSNIIHWNWFNHRQHRMQPSQVQKIIMVQPSSWSHIFLPFSYCMRILVTLGKQQGTPQTEI